MYLKMYCQVDVYVNSVTSWGVVYPIYYIHLDSLQVLPWKSFPARIVEARVWIPLMCKRKNSSTMLRHCGNTDGASNHNFLLQSTWRFNKIVSSKCGLFSISYGCLLKLGRHFGSLPKRVNYLEKSRQHTSVLFVPLFVGVMLLMSVSVAVTKSPSCKFGFIWSFCGNLQHIQWLDLSLYISSEYVSSFCRGPNWRESPVLRGLENNWSCICWQNF